MLLLRSSSIGTPFEYWSYKGEPMKVKCKWCGDDPIYIAYHDYEWGKPLYDDQKLFELLVLESMQAGLSWITILKKRDNFRRAFDNFEIAKVATYDEAKIEELLLDSSIIRNRLKLTAAVNNAQQVLRIQQEFGSFSAYIWLFVDNQPIINSFHSEEEVPANTELSDFITKEMKKQGFKFIGTTIIYSFMQAMGMVNDHVTNCFRYRELTESPK